MISFFLLFSEFPFETISVDKGQHSANTVKVEIQFFLKLALIKTPNLNKKPGLDMDAYKRQDDYWPDSFSLASTYNLTCVLSFHRVPDVHTNAERWQEFEKEEPLLIS